MFDDMIADIKSNKKKKKILFLLNCFLRGTRKLNILLAFI